MKSQTLLLISILICFGFTFWGCEKDFFKPESEVFNVKSFINNIKSYNVNADYIEDIIPSDASSTTEPYVSVQSWVIKGKDVLISITVPDDTEELYFGAVNSYAEYMGLNFSESHQNSAPGFYRLKLNDISNSETSSNGLINYQVVLSSNENIQLDKFDLIVGCKTTTGVSNKVTVPLDVIGIAPYQENLRVGFRPLSGYTYTIEITTPTGANISYSYDKNSGTESFNNSQSPNSTILYDSGLDFKWIDFFDPDFGGYTMTTTIQIDITGGPQYIYLYLAIITEGKIEQVSLDADVQQTGQNTAVGTALLGFSYFDELSAKVNMTAYRQQTQFFTEQPVPDNQKTQPGVGIRHNGNNKNENLIKVILNANPAIPPEGIVYLLKRNNQNIKVWGDPFGTYPILYDNDEEELYFPINMEDIYVENITYGNADLEFIAKKDDNIISSDIITFVPYKSVVILYGGEGSNPPDANQGIWNLANELYRDKGYDVYKYSENDCFDLTTSSNSYNLIIESINYGNVTNVAILGYSHGGGSTYLLAKRIMDNNINVNVSFTAYIDAIMQPFTNSSAERRIPCRSKVHVNYYQRNWVQWIPFAGNSWNNIECGYNNPSVIQFDVSELTPDMNHSIIHKNQNVINGIRQYMIAWVER